MKPENFDKQLEHIEGMESISFYNYCAVLAVSILLEIYKLLVKKL